MIPYAAHSCRSPKPTPLTRAAAAAARANMWSCVEGWAAIEVFTDEVEEYHALKRGAGLIDLSPVSRWRFSGAEAAACLDRLTTASTAAMDAGECANALLCDDGGAVMDIGRVYKVDEEIFFMEIARARALHIRKACRGLKVAAANLTESLGALAVLGPSSDAMLTAFGFESGHLNEDGRPRVARRRIRSVDIVVLPLAFGALRGYELAFPADEALAVWERMYRAGREMGAAPVGLRAFDAVRIESGVPRPGADFVDAESALSPAERRTPFEIGLEDWAALDGGWYSGRRAVRRAAVSPRKSILAALAIDAEAARPGDLVYADGAAVGRLTSTAYSGDFSSAVGMAEIRPDFARRERFEVGVLVPGGDINAPARCAARRIEGALGASGPAPQATEAA
ncbi:MAG: hypothetical protein Tsb0010_11720 [Parvularculaceae bacterium]